MEKPSEDSEAVLVIWLLLLAQDTFLVIGSNAFAWAVRHKLWLLEQGGVTSCRLFPLPFMPVRACFPGYHYASFFMNSAFTKQLRFAMRLRVALCPRTCPGQAGCQRAKSLPHLCLQHRWTACELERDTSFAKAATAEQAWNICR